MLLGEISMNNIVKYFTQGTAEWEKTIKTCLLLGLFIGLIVGGIILHRIIT